MPSTVPGRQPTLHKHLSKELVRNYSRNHFDLLIRKEKSHIHRYGCPFVLSFFFSFYKPGTDFAGYPKCLINRFILVELNGGY